MSTDYLVYIMKSFTVSSVIMAVQFLYKGTLNFSRHVIYK